MASHKIVKRVERRALPRPAVSRGAWERRGRERADHAMRTDAGTQNTLAEAANWLLYVIGENPEFVAEGWMEQHGEAAPISAFVAYQAAYLERLREVAGPAGVQ